ncbi:phage tail protein [Aquitalea sp. ASV11]|uniref:phage tail protein n=1 Tax=Aquitalea sp. ASV11 TaxID=2795103 RepID=UPI0018EA9388|nr:phage tail protein [Aquitalea sp. ASV11]
MNKPASLRAALENALPELRDNPDRLLMFIEQGNLAARPGSLSFSYGYTLSIVVLDFAGHPDSIMVPVLDWVQVNEPPLMQNADRLADGLKFEAEILSTSSWDFRLTIKLTERVSVQKQDDGSVSLAHLPEPKADWE